MRKARLAATLDDSRPLRLSVLKLEGFVVDHLPFKAELRNLVLLSCGEGCVDAGLRAPKPEVASGVWNHLMPGVETHCLIDWPHYTGISNGSGSVFLVEDEEDRGLEMVAHK
jgi:hypothetical protein